MTGQEHNIYTQNDGEEYRTHFHDEVITSQIPRLGGTEKSAVNQDTEQIVRAISRFALHKGDLVDHYGELVEL